MTMILMKRFHLIEQHVTFICHVARRGVI